MRNRLLRLTGLFAVFAVLSGGDCNIGSLGDILDEPGTIVVTNIGQESAVLAITADDVRSFPTLSGGGSVTVTTNVGGAYHVTIAMTPENATAYLAELQSIRSGVEALIAGSTDPTEKTNLFLNLSGIKATITALQQSGGVSCTGRLSLDPDDAKSVTATANWVPQNGSGFWDLTCGSN